jgi:hypothetical protein
MNDPVLFSFEGSVTETWDGGFEIEVRGESRPRRVDFADVSSLQLSRRLGRRIRKGALIGGVTLAGLGFLVGYCFNVSGNSDACKKDVGAGIEGLWAGVFGALIGAGIGWMFTHYGPFEDVDLEGPRSSDVDRLSVGLLPYPDGRIGLGVTLSVGGGR